MPVLLVEDQPDIAEMYAMGLRAAKYDVVVTSSAEEGAIALARDHPEFVLLDVGLPGMSGLDFLGLIRAAAGTEEGRLPVAMLTNYSDRDFRGSAAALGALDYLVKTDVRPSGLVSLMGTWIAADVSWPETFDWQQPAATMAR